MGQGESSKTKKPAQLQIQASGKNLYIENTVPKIKRSTSVFEKYFPTKSFSKLSIGELSNNSNQESITSNNVQIPIFPRTRKLEHIKSAYMHHFQTKNDDTIFSPSQGIRI